VARSLVDRIVEASSRSASPADQINRVRDVLQQDIMRSVSSGVLKESVAMLGGTTLRMLTQIPRYSEDIDASSTAQWSTDRFTRGMGEVLTELADSGMACRAKAATNRTVNTCLFIFDTLRKRLGLPGDPRESLRIKFEVDTRPPPGSQLKTSQMEPGGVSLTLVHYDMPSMFAGKLHAILQRGYDKGRDFYDLYWYLEKGIRPNMRFLNEALKQSGWDKPQLLPGKDTFGTV